MSSSVRVERADDGFGLGIHRSVVIMLWRGAATPERLRAATRLVERHANETDDRIAVLTVIEPSAPPPDAEATKELGRDHRRLAASLWAVAVVLEGLDNEEALDAGLAIDAARGTVPFPQRYSADIREAIAWLAARDPRGPRDAPFRERLLEAVEQVRRAIG